jgi:hypothetical protein
MPPAWSTGAVANTVSRSRSSKQLRSAGSLVFGTKVTAAQVVIALLDLKLTRLCRDPKHIDSIVDVAGYAAVLREVSR